MITVAQRQCVAFEVIQESRYLSMGKLLNKNWCDILFCLKSCGYLRTAKRIISIGDQSNLSYDTFHLSDLLAAQTSKEFLEDGIGKLSSVNYFKTRTPFSCLVILRFHPLYIFILCF